MGGRAGQGLERLWLHPVHREVLQVPAHRQPRRREKSERFGACSGEWGGRDGTGRDGGEVCSCHMPCMGRVQEGSLYIAGLIAPVSDIMPVWNRWAPVWRCAEYCRFLLCIVPV